MRKLIFFLVVLFCLSNINAQWELDGGSLWLNTGIGLGGPGSAGFLIESGLFFMLKDDPLSLVAALDLDWRLLDGVALPLEIGAGWLLIDDEYYYHHIYLLAGWDFVTGEFCASVRYRIYCPIAAYFILGWDKGPRLMAGFTYGYLFE